MHIVLVEPDIHWNTGNIGRTCAATATTLHLVGRLGFSLDSKEIRRAGLDYWSRVALERHRDFDAFLASAGPEAPLLLFSTRAPKVYWDAPFSDESYLIFGSETRGLPEDILGRFGDRLYRIPVGPEIRSLNLSTAAAVALYEGLRRAAVSAGADAGPHARRLATK